MKGFARRVLERDDDPLRADVDLRGRGCAAGERRGRRRGGQRARALPDRALRPLPPRRPSGSPSRGATGRRRSAPVPLTAGGSARRRFLGAVRGWKRMIRRLLLSMLSLATVLASCTTADDGPGGDLDTSYSAQMASTWHYVGTPAADPSWRPGERRGRRASRYPGLGRRLVLLPRHRRAVGGSHGHRDVHPGAGDRRLGRRRLSRSQRDEAEDVTFDDIWRATLSIEIDSVPRRLTTDFRVGSQSGIPGAANPDSETTRKSVVSRRGTLSISIDSVARQMPASST